MNSRAQIFSIVALLLCLLVLIISSINVQSSMLKEIELENLLFMENISVNIKKIFLRSVVESSAKGDAHIFRCCLADFHDFVLNFLDGRIDFSLKWNGNVTFNWNSSYSYTRAFLKIFMDYRGAVFQESFMYDFSVNVKNVFWNESFGRVVIEALMNGEKCMPDVIIHAFINGVWRRLTNYKSSFNGTFLLSFENVSRPSSLFLVVQDENGVIVRVRVDL